MRIFGRKAAHRTQQKAIENDGGISELSPGEVQWRDGNLEVAQLLAARLDPAAPDELPSLERLDAVVTTWYAEQPAVIGVNDLVNAVGLALGEHLARSTGLRWVVATDEDGSELALHGQPGDVLVHPANVVAKRIVQRETGFVRAVHDELAAAVTQRLGGG